MIFVTPWLPQESFEFLLNRLDFLLEVNFQTRAFLVSVEDLALVTLEPAHWCGQIHGH